MIIREIKERPFEVVGNFDWFNDYDDTRRWAKSACDHETVALFEAGFALWLKRRNVAEGSASQSKQANQREWCFQWLCHCNCDIYITGAFVKAATFSEACAILAKNNELDDFNFRGGDAESFVRQNAQGAVEVAGDITHEIAWNSDIRGLWPNNASQQRADGA